MVSTHNLNRKHLEEFYTWASDHEVASFMTWDAYQNKEEALSFLINVAEKHPFFKLIDFEGRGIGSLTLSPGKDSASCRAELGYVINKSYWGKGIATLAVKKAIQDGFKELNIERIEALVDPENAASIRVLEKAGMKCEGLLKNYLLFKGKIKDRLIYSISRTP